VTERKDRYLHWFITTVQKNLLPCVQDIPFYREPKKEKKKRNGEEIERE
jgi:hypothetical protein